jgi:hypothetical protein
MVSPHLSGFGLSCSAKASVSPPALAMQPVSPGVLQ